MDGHRRTPGRHLLGGLCTAVALTGCTLTPPEEQEPDSASSPAVTANPSQRPSTPPGSPPGSPDSSAPAPGSRVDVAAENLTVPWGLDFLPDGTALVSERDSGRVLAVEPRGQEYRTREVGVVPATAAEGEAGLLGIAVHPDFPEDRRVYLYVTTETDNRIVSAEYDGNRLGPTAPVLTGIPNGFVHDGGRLAFGPDGFLYASTGETGEPDLAQDLDSLGGKILRVTPDGDPAPGNPYDDSPVYSYGHRNVQGLAFDRSGQLWASEFGDSSFDELNRIEPGANYGWPMVEGTGPSSADGEQLTNPAVVWATGEASPSGLAFWRGQLWLGALMGERLWSVPMTGANGVGQPAPVLAGRFGRLRSVEVSPDGDLWVTTSNADGRGDPAPADDRILVLPG